jgi:hypothetical protein
MNGKDCGNRKFCYSWRAPKLKRANTKEGFDSMAAIVGILIAFVGMGFLVGSIARRRGRPFGLWFILGGLFGLVSLIVLLIIPRLEAVDYRGGDSKGQKPCPECHE